MTSIDPGKTNENRVIIVDVETSGLDPEQHVVLEVAAIDLSDTGEGISFVPDHPNEWVRNADPVALSVNKYFERRVFDEQLTNMETRVHLRQLSQMLEQATVAGSNPSFDVTFLRSLFAEHKVPFPRIHHRLLDLSPYAAGALKLGTRLPGLARVCELLDVDNTAPHTALGDARATADCLAALMGGDL